MHPKFSLTLFLSVGLTSGTQVIAAGPDQLDRLSACRIISDDAKRLACYDQAVVALEASVKAKEVVVIDRATLQNERRRQFGLISPEDPSYRAANVAAPTELKGKIVAVSKAGQFYRLSIEGAGAWETTEYAFRGPSVGSEVVISKGALGSHTISYNRQSVRIRRLR
jgi:hypothetical protein